MKYKSEYIVKFGDPVVSNPKVGNLLKLDFINCILLQWCCLICDSKVRFQRKSIQTHLTHQHKISISDYEEEYGRPEGEIFVDEVNITTTQPVPNPMAADDHTVRAVHIPAAGHLATVSGDTVAGQTISADLTQPGTAGHSATAGDIANFDRGMIDQTSLPRPAHKVASETPVPRPDLNTGASIAHTQFNPNQSLEQSNLSYRYSTPANQPFERPPLQHLVGSPKGSENIPTSSRIDANGELLVLWLFSSLGY